MSDTDTVPRYVVPEAHLQIVRIVALWRAGYDGPHIARLLEIPEGLVNRVLWEAL